ncbi:hypothetical protein P5673_029918 [Acropora cervicornis]|uniref:Uncharacterized protein n=1 Tax=Acropora cervicornis TaxID=6130 RepID=A0AAD9PVQ0_ACRCE|nr:hypothetical protein P5673_029918 [Acropora cervicornis]
MLHFQDEKPKGRKIDSIVKQEPKTHRDETNAKANEFVGIGDCNWQSRYFLWVYNQEIGLTLPHFGFWQFVINLGRVWKLVFLSYKKQFSGKTIVNHVHYKKKNLFKLVDFLTVEL